MLESAPGEPSAAGAVVVPATLQASLLARFDRMPTARQVAQIAAVLGRDFPRTLLGAVADLPDAALEEGLDQLVAAGLLFRRGEGANAFYIFKHALVQNTAYDSLLRARRGVLHEATALMLERDPETAASRPALLGHHFALAGHANKASLYFLRAGAQSASASAMAEAEAHLTRGLALAAEITSPADRNRRKAMLLLTLGYMHTVVHGFGSPEQGANYAEAVELCRTLDPRDAASEGLLIWALTGQSSHEMHIGNLAKAYEVVQGLLATGNKSADPQVRAVAACTYGACCMFLARFEDGRRAFESAVDAGVGLHTAPWTGIGFDAQSTFRAQYAWMLELQGFPEQARTQLHLALDRTREIQHFPTTALVLIIACSTARILRDNLALEQWSQALIRMASEQSYALYQLRGRGYAAWLRAMEDKHEDSLPLLNETMSQLGMMGMRLGAPSTRGMRADIHSVMGRADLADADLDDALEICARTGEVWEEADFHRRKGELRHADPAAAEACFQRALTIARAQRSKLFELRTSVSLGRLWCENGRRVEARELLAPIYGWFTEGFDVPDLVEARVLLDTLRTD